MRIGIDLDNTILDYSKSYKILAPSFVQKSTKISKNNLKKKIIKNKGMNNWWEFQSALYTKGLKYAKINEFCKKFIKKNIECGHDVFIISHKTKKSYFDKKIFLRELAIEKLKKEKLISKKLIKRKNIFFYEKFDDKIKKIKKLKLNIFIDDLVKVFLHQNFPKKCKKILLNNEVKNSKIISYSSWKQLHDNQ